MNNILHKIKRFFFEFVIVTLGILTAFSINKWDENRKLKAEELTSYKSLRSDLKSELFTFNYYKKPMIAAKAYLMPILEKNYENIDSLTTHLSTSFDLQERNATYTNLKFSGKLELLGNRKIKTRVILYYETYYQGLENMSKWNYDFHLNFVQPYMIKKMKYNTTNKDVLAHLEQDEFLNLIKSQYQLIEYNLTIIKRSEELVQKTIEEIETELEKENLLDKSLDLNYKQ